MRFAYRLAGENPSGQVALNFSKAGRRLAQRRGAELQARSPGRHTAPPQWAEFRQVFLPTAITASGQFAFTAGDGSTLWIDDVSLRAVPRPAELAEPTLPWEGLKRRTANRSSRSC